MKKTRKVNLNQLSKEELDSRQMNQTRGGDPVCSICEANCSLSACIPSMDALLNVAYDQLDYAADDLYMISYKYDWGCVWK